MRRITTGVRMKMFFAVLFFLAFSRCTDWTRDVEDWGLAFDIPIRSHVDENGMLHFNYAAEDELEANQRASNETELLHYHLDVIHDEMEMDSHKKPQEDICTNAEKSSGSNHASPATRVGSEAQSEFRKPAKRTAGNAKRMKFVLITDKTMKKKRREPLDMLQTKTREKKGLSMKFYHDNLIPYSNYYEDIRRILCILNPHDERLLGDKPAYASILIEMVVSHLDRLLKARKLAPEASINHGIFEHFPVDQISLQRLQKCLEIRRGEVFDFSMAKSINIEMGTSIEHTEYANQAACILAKWFVAILAFCGEHAMNVVTYDPKTGLLYVPNI